MIVHTTQCKMQPFSRIIGDTTNITLSVPECNGKEFTWLVNDLCYDKCNVDRLISMNVGALDPDLFEYSVQITKGESCTD